MILQVGNFSENCLMWCAVAQLKNFVRVGGSHTTVKQKLQLVHTKQSAYNALNLSQVRLHSFDDSLHKKGF